jgi:hypothetical protein
MYQQMECDVGGRSSVLAAAALPFQKILRPIAQLQTMAAANPRDRVRRQEWRRWPELFDFSLPSGRNPSAFDGILTGGV